MRPAAYAVATVLLLLSLYHYVQPAHASHGLVRCGGTGDQACILLTTPFLERVVRPAGEITWCVNARAASYPNFIAQVQTVTQKQAEQLGMTQRRVAYPASAADTSCLVRHDMPAVHGCSDCGAWIYLSSFPMLIEYNWQQGYSHFDSTIGHEQGHGFCLEDEHYDKQNFRSWILTYGYWQHGSPTVMDSGTPYLSAYAPLGIWNFTDYDLARCTESIGRQVPPPPQDCTPGPPYYVAPGVTTQWYPCEGNGGQWIQSNGYRYEPATGWWGFRDIGFSPCDVYGLRQIPAIGATMPGLHSIYVWAYGYWITVPGC